MAGFFGIPFNVPYGAQQLDKLGRLVTDVKSATEQYFHIFNFQPLTHVADACGGAWAYRDGGGAANDLFYGLYNGAAWNPYILMAIQDAGARPAQMFFHANNYAFKCDSVNDIVFNDYDTGEAFTYFHRFGAKNYGQWLKVGGVWRQVAVI
jgi:hypothetical protein